MEPKEKKTKNYSVVNNRRELRARGMLRDGKIRKKMEKTERKKEGKRNEMKGRSEKKVNEDIE